MTPFRRKARLCVVLVFIIVVVVGRYGYTERTWSNVKDSTPDSPKLPRLDLDSSPLYMNKFNTCTKGEVLIDKDFMIAELPQFIKVYDKRPGENHLGTRFAHQFAMWCAVRKLQPLHIIESGVFRGLGSWLLRQAAPHAQLILLDPSNKQAYRDKHPDTLYFTGKNFTDFTQVEWSSLNLDITRTLVYFDDHQSGLLRTHQASKRGFRYIMFDDNYNPNDGDNFSLKAACAVKLGKVDPKALMFKDNFGKNTRPLEYSDLALIDNVFDSHITHYMEFPLPWASDDVRYDTLIKNNNKDKKYTMEHPNQHFTSPSDKYFNVCLVKLNN